MMTFSERIRLRRRLWWREPHKWRDPLFYRDLPHRLSETHRLRSRHDSDARWQCCDRWQRSLNNKWNAREFVVRYGCRVPDLYWHGRRVSRIPFDSLPPNFVIRPVWGAYGRGTFVMVSGRDILHERDYTPGELARTLHRQQGAVNRFPVLVEEFVVEEPGVERLPTEYKFFMFGGTIGSISVLRRTSREVRAAYFTSDWERVPDAIQVLPALNEGLARPPCFNEMCAEARRLGAACGTFMRADFYAGSTGAVFAEFASTPSAGRHFTPFGDRYLGDLWQRECPDKI